MLVETETGKCYNNKTFANDNSFLLDKLKLGYIYSTKKSVTRFVILSTIVIGSWPTALMQ